VLVQQSFWPIVPLNKKGFEQLGQAHAFALQLEPQFQHSVHCARTSLLRALRADPLFRWCCGRTTNVVAKQALPFIFDGTSEPRWHFSAAAILPLATASAWRTLRPAQGP